MGFGTWLLALMGPFTARVLITLGFSVVTVVGMEAILSTLRAQLIASMNQVPAEALAMAMLGGVGEGLGIIMGAAATRLLLWKVSNATRLLGVNT